MPIKSKKSKKLDKSTESSPPLTRNEFMQFLHKVLTPTSKSEQASQENSRT